MPNSRKVLLIGWDAADWKVIHPLMDAGLMPNMNALVERGASGQISTLHPPFSPMLWTSIATGKRPYQHGIHGFSEPTPDGRGVQPITNLSRKVKAIWNMLTQRNLRSIVVGWWPSYPAEPINGVMVSNHYHQAFGPLNKGWPLRAGNVHPPELHDKLAEMRFHPDEAPGEMLEFFIPKAREIEQDKDKRLASCAKVLCECISIHSAATWLLENETWDFAAIYYDAIDHFSHGFMKYHPPRQEFIKEADFDLYQGVVNAAYRFHDQMLGALLKQTGPETTVVLMSDHGFHPDHLRPRGIPREPAGPAAEHRDFGIVALAGPGIKRDHLLHGAGLLDICPTVLSLFDLPVGEDMDGKVLVDAFETPPEIATIASWEEIPGQDGRHAPETQLDPVAAKESLDQLVALGYIEKPDDDVSAAVAGTIRELRYNLALSLQDDDRHAAALEILRELHSQNPDEQRFAVRRFLACQALGHIEEMLEIVCDLDGRRRELYLQAVEKVKALRDLAKQRAIERRKSEVAPAEDTAAKPSPNTPARPVPLLDQAELEEFARQQKLARFEPATVDYLKAQLLAIQGYPQDALRLLESLSQAKLLRPGLYLQTAEMLCLLRRWKDAHRAYSRALAVDPDNAHAHLGLCRIALKRRKYESAIEHALSAIGRTYHLPSAHYLLGMALANTGRDERAVEAFRVALSQNPNFPQAHRRLVQTLNRLGRQDEARETRAADGRSAMPAEKLPGSKRSTIFDFDGQQGISFPPVNYAEPIRDEIVIVSGLPRSGTSMLMQMLAAGGLSLVADDAREADDNNPRGYFEYEPVKTLAQDATWLKQARGKGIKIVAPLLRYLSSDEKYRILFIERDLDEVLESQQQMLDRLGATAGELQSRRERLRKEYQRQLDALRVLFHKWTTAQVLPIHHARAIRDPATAARRINAFLGGILDEAQMVAAIDANLHRIRTSTA